MKFSFVLLTALTAAAAFAGVDPDQKLERTSFQVAGSYKDGIDLKSDVAMVYGIGGCGSAEIQTFIPEAKDYETDKISGMLELVSMTGNVSKDENGEYCHHTHGMFCYKENGEHKSAGGHIKSAVVLITAEIEIRPVPDGSIKRKFSDETGTKLWSFN